MLRKRKKTLPLKVFVVLLTLAMTTAGFSANAGSARITPLGTVSIIENGQVVGQFSQESPLPEGSLLRCEAQCTVRMNDAYMVAKPNALFSVSPMADSTELLVQESTVYFSINESSRPFRFNTPDGIVTTRQILLTDNELMGYVRVFNNKTEVGVIAGGTMKVDTPKGEMTIPPEKNVTLSRVDTGPPVSTVAGAEEGTGITATDVMLGVVGTAVIVGGIYGINYAITHDGSNGGGGGSGSPSSP